MKLSNNGLALIVLLVANVILIILLTPVGFETRPLSHVTTAGLVGLGAVFAGLVLDVVSIGLIFRRARLASISSAVGTILVFPGLISDQTGYFSSISPPGAISIVEYALAVVAVVTLFFASMVYRESRSG